MCFLLVLDIIHKTKKSKMKNIIFLFFLVITFTGTRAQSLSPVLGVADRRPEIYAFTNATIVVDAETTLEKASMLIEKGKIIAVGNKIDIPADAVVEDLNGKYIYPSFIDLFSKYGIDSKTLEKPRSFMSRPVWDSKENGSCYWNDAIKPYLEAVNDFHVDDKLAKPMRDVGFGAVLTQKHDGIMRGTSALVSLKNDDEEKVVIKGKAATGYSVLKGSSEMNYPNSLMGVAALLRQTLYDADWYKNKSDKSIYDESLEAINSSNQLPAVFQVQNKLELIRFAQIGQEFNKSFVMKGNGDEYQLAEEIEAAGVSLILPLNFPEAPDVSDAFEAVLVPYEDLKHWELAPANPAVLVEKNVEFAFTSDGLKDKKEFRKNLLKAIEYGLSKEDALRALTSTSAKLIGLNKEIGTLESGKVANFLITSGDYFDKDCVVYENWVQGEKYVIKKKDATDFTGNYELALSNGTKLSAEITGEEGKYKLKLISGEEELKGKFKVTDNLASIYFAGEGKYTRLSGWVEARGFTGSGVLPDGQKVSWTMKFEKEAKADSINKKKAETEKLELGSVIYPFVAYGNKTQPKYEDVLIKNATVWTLESDGVLENTDVLIKDGKIAKIGIGLNAGGAKEIDGTGMHLSPGIIDEHSHIGLNGTNEATHAVTSEVRMRDVLNPEDISFYRQLAGGVTCAQLLHGSANPIGGQSVIVKFRWGAPAEDMVVKNQVGFLKHALGENVKQSRYPSFIANRFPQTRMGVEQTIRDAYLRAVEYKAKLEAGEPVRKDLQLDAIVDVLNKKSFMGVHTYVQSETNMIIKLAQEFGIKPHTLIHNTEGYKIADQMKEAGAAGSLFADWWAFKFEVYDAIPYNAAILTKNDVLSCIHSDDPELARHLNQEAAKAIKYGGLSEIEALKLVTLNTAKIFHLDHRMGSIKVGKDADLVLWTDNPLSIYAKAAKTFVDGTIYYDMETDKAKYKEIQKERSRIIDKILAADGEKGAGASDKKAPVGVNNQYIYDDECADNYNLE